MNSFCTIITADYFFYAQALFDSLKQFDSITKFQVLVVGKEKVKLVHPGIHVYLTDDLKVNFKEEYNLIKHYEIDEASNLRWALKPLFLKFLLTEKQFDKVLFLDPDLYFYSDPSFLFERLHKVDVIITPHWRSKDPINDSLNFDWLFNGGLFNAGFFGCNKNSINILDWWLRACSYKMEKADGFYVDQAYLNLLPIYFESQVEILQHKGCNVANWNMVECERSKAGDTVLISEEYPVVFIHFTNGTINLIINGTDTLLKPFLEEYKGTLLKYNSQFKFNFEKELEKPYARPSLVQKIKRRLKL